MSPVYNTRIMGPAHVANVTDLACRTALCHRARRPHHLSGRFSDLQAPADRSEAQRAEPHLRSLSRISAGLPHDDDLRRAAEVLNDGKKVAILAGRGALGASDELEQLAEMLGSAHH